MSLETVFKMNGVISYFHFFLLNPNKLQIRIKILYIMLNFSKSNRNIFQKHFSLLSEYVELFQFQFILKLEFETKKQKKYMTYRFIRPSATHPEYFASYKAQGMRRLNATQPKQEEIYIDTRNLWKASTTSQQKQYEAIKGSGLLNNKRKLTFMKFNYRSAQQRNVCYHDVFKFIDNNQKSQYASQSKIRIKKLKENINHFTNRITEEIRENKFRAQKNWLQEYHINQKQPDQVYSNQYVPQGTMNINDLWGEKQLQQCVGYLPCTRDRPKMLKFYSSNLKKRKNRATQGMLRCRTDYY